MNRQTLRQKLRTKRYSISASEQQNISLKIVANLSEHPLWKKSQYIAGYMPLGSEIDATLLLQLAQQQNKTCYLPALTEQALHFVQYRLGDALKPNRFNIPEPEITADKIINPTQLDLVLTPLVAFDSQGNRLGMGAGYYDRTFNFLQSQPRPSKPYLLGLAYEWQKVDGIDAESWDVTLNGAITEQKLYQF